MRSAFLMLMAIVAFNCAYAQNTFTAVIKDSKTKEGLAGVTANIVGTATGSSTDANGLVILTAVADGRQVVQYNSIGYISKTDTFIFPLSNSDTIIAYLEAEDEEMEEVVVSTTRSSRTIQDIPTRIELIGGEELGEKANMKPGDIRMMLSESTGIQTLQTSATSGNSSIRIQGLDGRYTQILKDGFPMYNGFSGGLGLLQTPPLDLKRVEIIKGASSTLYGGGAIAGLINLISKTPTAERELRFLINGTSAGGLDINGYYGQRFGKIGLTVYAARNSNSAYAPSGTEITAIPKFERYTLNPKLFIYFSPKTEAVIGVNAATESRIGGDIHYVKGEGNSVHSYYEDNKTQRISSQVELKHKFTGEKQLLIKNSIAHFDRVIHIPGYTFDGTQTNTFTEISYSTRKEKLEWVAGGNLLTDGFAEKRLTALPLRDYQQNTIGAFVQNTWDVNKKLFIESGLRGDYVMDYGFSLLPRLSVLYKANAHLSSRLGGGLGYKTPTIFTEESERIQYQNVLPISTDSNKLERSYGINWDANYKTSFADGKISFSVNQLFFYTHLNNPLMLIAQSNGLYSFSNIPGHIDAQGAETNIKLGYKHFKLFLGYTYTHSHIHQGGITRETPLTPQHHTNSVLMYEVEDKWRVGLEAYYYSPQKLGDGSTGRDYWLCGFMVEKTIHAFSLFINFENMLDSRQSRYGTIYTGSLDNPQFKDIYAPLDGFVFNGGLKLKL